MTSDHIRYQIKQIQEAPEDEEKLARLLEMVKEEGGHVNILLYPDGTHC